MRWTTSPRLSLELALVRATLPETDPHPAGLVARMERLERLANLDVADHAPSDRSGAGQVRSPAEAPSPADDRTPAERRRGAGGPRGRPSPTRSRGAGARRPARA